MPNHDQNDIQFENWFSFNEVMEVWSWCNIC